MRGERVRKTQGRAPNATAAGNDLQRGIADASVPAYMQAAPQVMVLRGGNLGPATRAQIGVRTDA